VKGATCSAGTCKACLPLPCPMIAVTQCETEVATQSNGCPGCPRCKVACSTDSDCKDGMYCGPKQCVAYLKTGDHCPLAMSALVNTIPGPRCAKGNTCTAGVCTACVPPPCAFLQCATEMTTLSNGCPGCPRCVPPPPCTSDASCPNGFCWSGRCVPWSGVGEGCQGFIIPPKRCRPGLICKITSHIPDVGGTCVQPKPPSPQPCGLCPVSLACPLAQQVDDTARVVSHCPPCKICSCPGGKC